MLYTYASFANNYLNMQELRAYDFWLAEYSTKPSYKGEYGIWQYTGNGRCDGIPTVCSLDIAYQDYPTIIQQAGLNRPLHPCIPAEEVKKLQQTIADLQNQLQTVTSEKNTYLKQITEIRNILK